MKRSLLTPHHIYWMTTQSDKVGVIYGYAHLIPSSVHQLKINWLLALIINLKI